MSVECLHKYFLVQNDKSKTKKIYSVNGVSFKVFPGETFGIVGESGCGKTTVGRMITCLTKPTEGRVIFDNQDLFALKKRDLNHVRRDIQMIFQDPFASLDPRMTIGQTLLEPMVIHKIGDKASRRRRVEEILEMVGLQTSYFDRYPHEFSGGQRQRIGIARVLTLQPKLVICDEPVSALDISVQSQIINLLIDLQKEFGLTYIFIAHGLNVVKHVSDRVGVMYLGKMVELLDSEELFESAAHPYTEALLSAIPVPDPARPSNRIILDGDIPSPASLPEGCFFHTRCRYCKDICRHIVPEEKWSGERMIACHFPLN